MKLASRTLGSLYNHFLLITNDMIRRTRVTESVPLDCPVVAGTNENRDPLRLLWGLVSGTEYGILLRAVESTPRGQRINKAFK
jgi:hypothetical protein